MNQRDPYRDVERADAYSKVGIINSYYLAYRDLPQIFSTYGVTGAALDFGCGTGRSTRFLREHGFSTVGVDIAEEMIVKAIEADPHGDYRTIDECDLGAFPNGSFDLVLSSMPFDSIPTKEEKVRTLREISRVLKHGGTKILIAASPEFYLHEWVSWSTKSFPENRIARSGDVVRVVIKDLGDDRVVEDYLWTDESYRETFAETPLRLVETRRPLAQPEDPYQCEWLNETAVAPFSIYVLKKAQ